MGTFHHGKSELHGITVIVDTKGPQVFVGRCDDIDDERVTLNDVSAHSDGDEGLSKDEFLKRTAKYGVTVHHAHVAIPRVEVASVRRLGEIAVE